MSDPAILLLIIAASVVSGVIYALVIAVLVAACFWIYDSMRDRL